MYDAYVCLDDTVQVGLCIGAWCPSFHSEFWNSVCVAAMGFHVQLQVVGSMVR